MLGVWDFYKTFNHNKKNVYLYMKKVEMKNQKKTEKHIILFSRKSCINYLNLELKTSNHLQFRFNYISEYYRERTNGYIINIITKEYLSDYLKLRENQFKKIFSENKHGLNY